MPINNIKIIAFTPGGRESVMQILKEYVEREHKKGNIDQWIIFNNAYTPEDEAYVRSLKNDWITIFEDDTPIINRSAETISKFYNQLTETDCVYLRIDDDIVFIEENAVENLVKFRLEHPEYFLIFPVIVNNTRMNYYLQEAGKIIFESKLLNKFLEKTSLFNIDFVKYLHDKVFLAIKAEKVLESFKIENRTLSYKVVDKKDNNDWYIHYEEGYISTNFFAIMGKDMIESNCTKFEENYFASTRPKELKRCNAVFGDAIVVHFCYGTLSGLLFPTNLLQQYGKLVGLSLPEKFEHPFQNGDGLKIIRNEVIS